VRWRDVAYYQPQIECVSQEQRKSILKLAEEICEGKIPFLSYDTQHLGLEPAWNRDFISGKEWPDQPSELLPTVRLDGSDVKVPWELSRMQFLPVLGKAYRLTGESKYRERAEQYVEDWIDNNSPGRGVNWMIAMEAALRGVSILLLMNLLSPIETGAQKWVQKVATSMWQHLVFIEGHLEFSHIVRGNHYLSNLLGLYALAVFLDGKGMEMRRRRYRELLEREIFVQTYEDGGNYEASTGYHILVMQMFLTAHRLMLADGVAPSPQFTARLRRMFGWAEAIADHHGRLPHIGDCDDGRVEFLHDDLHQMASMKAEQRDSLRVAEFLNLGKTMLDGNSASCAVDGPWFGLQPTTCTDSTRSAQTERHEIVLPQSGIAHARWGKNDLLLLAVPNGIYGKGTHTHNDKLSVILIIDGEEVLCDPGTGCYTRDAKKRNRFRSTGYHNTFTVDGEEQNRIPSSAMSFFSLGNEAKVGKITALNSRGVNRLETSLSGSSKGRVHTRAVEWCSERGIQIEDRFTGAGSHRFEATFHLGPGWKIVNAHDGPGSAGCVLHGTKRVSVTFESRAQLEIVEEDAAVSWVYATTVPSKVIRVKFESELPASFLTKIWWDE